MKSRLQIAMENAGVTIEELADYLIESDEFPDISKEIVIEHIKYSYIENLSDNVFDYAYSYFIRMLCMKLNCDSDFLLGLSDTINKIG